MDERVITEKAFRGTNTNRQHQRYPAIPSLCRRDTQPRAGRPLTIMGVADVSGILEVYHLDRGSRPSDTNQKRRNMGIRLYYTSPF